MSRPLPDTDPLIEAVDTIEAVRRCLLADVEDDEIGEHYDCKEDLTQAIKLLEQVKEEL